MCTMSLNTELNGIELYFENKPETPVIESLKSTGYRWHKFKKCWYAKQNERTMAKASELSSSESPLTLADNIPNENKSEEPFYPDYDKVNGTKIFKSCDGMSAHLNKSGYFADINCYVRFYDTSAVIIDLNNAMQTGKTCDKYYLEQIEWSIDYSDMITNLLNKSGLNTIDGIVNAIKSGVEIKGVKIQKSTLKSINVFSPFVEVKPIKTPAKWTRAHVWKAILSGQIFRGETDYYYSDDYAYDAATNYRTGCGLYLPDVAQDLIEGSCSGDSFRAGETIDGVTQVHFSTFTFTSKTLYFDEQCDHVQKRERLQRRQDELQAHNENMLASVLDIKENDIEENAVYNITYLDMDSNTGRYGTKTEMKYSGSLFYDGECNYKMTKCERFIPENRALYALSNFYNRPYGDSYKDKRIIDMGNWQHIVTGYTLNELLAEGNRYACIKKADPNTIERAREELQGRVAGRIHTMFMKDETDYSQSLYRLNVEEARIPDESEDNVLCLTFH